MRNVLRDIRGMYVMLSPKCAMVDEALSGREYCPDSMEIFYPVLYSFSCIAQGTSGLS